MKIELMKIVVRGLELLNVKFEKTTTHQYNLPDHWADLTVKSVWNEDKEDEFLAAFSPFTSQINFRLKRRSVMFLVEFVLELTKGSAEIGFKFNLMQDENEERRPLNNM